MLSLSAPVFFIFLFLLLGWMGFISFLLFKAVGNYNRLTRGLTDKTLSEVLKNLLDQNEVTQAEQKKIYQEFKDLRHDSLRHIQKIGLVRFNPFSDTGGDQSFVVALLDGAHNGIVVTSLYARTGTRWYVKTIKQGKAIEYDLSQEEKEAIKKVTNL